MRRRHLLMSVACVVLVTAALVGGVSVAGAAAPAKSTTATITIKNFKFSPSTLKVKAGTKITVKNADSTTHTLTANKGAFDTGHIGAGSSKTITVKKAGTYPYHCEIHDYMTGTIKVT